MIYDGRTPRRIAGLLAETVKKALDKVFSHFAVFGTVFSFDSRMELVQRYEPGLIPETEISYVSEETFEKEIRPAFVRPFRLFNSLLWRCGIFVTTESTYILMHIYHYRPSGQAAESRVRVQ